MKMRKTVIHLLLIGILGLSHSACTLRSRQKNETNAKDNGGKTKIVVTKDMTASDLADAGEQLVTPYTFMLADKTFSMALEKNPNHGKALFYKALLNRFMVFKGILTRIKPLVEKNGNMRDFNQTVRKIPNSAMKTFLLDGEPDIKDAYSAQTFINQYVRSVNVLREFLINNPEMQFTINLNPYLYEEKIREEWGKSCKILPSDAVEMEVECNAQDVALKKVNAADLLVLRQIAAGEVLAFSLYASYSLEGLEKLSKIKNFNELPYQTQLQLAKSQQHFLTLRPDHVMNYWESIAQDLVAAVRWSEVHHRDLCPKGAEHSGEQREGYVFANGFCLPNDSTSVNDRDEALAKIEKALRGTIPFDGLDEYGKDFHTEIDPLVLARKPILDLKALMPEELPACGQKPVLPDTTLGGVFPRGDAAEHMGPGVCGQ